MSTSVVKVICGQLFWTISQQIVLFEMTNVFVSLDKIPIIKINRTLSNVKKIDVYELIKPFHQLEFHDPSFFTDDY